ncbi:Transcription factor GLABRA 3 [Senna tora]|uniref:Transcription factor GLABRA 3 n=1 Tax=Senna tora TaxID=362788 RepID=A0A834SWW6_9FABA|nr:Transcription factor GLABRA 3 [Senna tora]
MVAENVKKQLALAVRSIQWSYAIFWSPSATQPGVLEWGEGFYNGDIKTRKTNQAVELNSDQIGLQRSEQLRELFESLATAEATPQTKRPSASLTPEDLTDTEWYYLVCMSFVFNVGQGLPGRVLVNGQPIWVHNAHIAEKCIHSGTILIFPYLTIFIQVNLVTSQLGLGIKTVVCFPFLEGVVELGTTDLISEDLGLIQRIRTAFLDILDAKDPKKSGPSLKTRYDIDVASVALDHNAYDANYTSPNSSSNAFEANQQLHETYMVERINGGASQVQSWQVMDDELSNGVHNSMNSSDCVSQTFADPEKIASVPNDQNQTDFPCAQDLQECNNTKITSGDLQGDQWHYQQVLSVLLKGSDQLNMGSHFQNNRKEFSFVRWNKGESMGCQRLGGGTSQNLLKKVLFDVPRMHMDGLLECQEENDFKDKERMKPEVEEIGMNHVLSERRRRAKLNERFLTLRSMVPSISKDDKVSILDDAIEYLRKLEKKVKELEACKELVDLETKTKRKPQDMVERTSDNYFNNKTDNGKKPMLNKRKACDIDETWRDDESVALKDSSTNSITISMSNSEVLIEMKCPWREGAMMEIMQAISSFHLDFHSVQSSEADGNLYLTIKSKFRGPTVASAKQIRQALLKAAWKC